MGNPFSFLMYLSRYPGSPDCRCETLLEDEAVDETWAPKPTVCRSTFIVPGAVYAISLRQFGYDDYMLYGEAGY